MTADDAAGFDADAAPQPSEDPSSTPLAALLTPIANGKVLAAICAINRAKGQVLETSAGTMAMLDDTDPESLDRAAAGVSAMSRDFPLLALERRDGQITVVRYANGQRGETLPPGLALNDAPGVVTTLMSGAQTIDDLAATHEDKVFSARMGRFKAVMQLRKLGAQARKQLG